MRQERLPSKDEYDRVLVFVKFNAKGVGDYLVTQVNNMFEKNDLAENTDAMNVKSRLEDVVRNRVKLQDMTSRFGIKPFENDFKALHDMNAKDVGAKLKEAGFDKGLLKMAFAIDKGSKLLRGFMFKDKMIDKEQEPLFDKMFNAFLAQHGMVSEDSVIYKADDKGNVLKGDDGESIKADPKEIIDKVCDKENGLAAFVAKNGFQYDVKNQKAPAEEVKEEAREEVSADAKVEVSATRDMKAKKDAVKREDLTPEEQKAILKGGHEAAQKITGTGEDASKTLADSKAHGGPSAPEADGPEEEERYEPE
jgi:hypothetical protein